MTISENATKKALEMLVKLYISEPDANERLSVLGLMVAIETLDKYPNVRQQIIEIASARKKI